MSRLQFLRVFPGYRPISMHHSSIRTNTAANLPFGEIRSIIIKVQHNCTSDRKRYGKMEDVPIKHEYCVIFKKPVCQNIGAQM
ncbi:hypothetical protein ACFL3Q_00195 [Planctomycetota bacterium]